MPGLCPHRVRDGKIERVRGGAVRASSEPPFEEIAVERFEARHRPLRRVAQRRRPRRVRLRAREVNQEVG